MPDTDTIWLAKILQKDEATKESLVMVRGIFSDEAEARRVASAFGCDAVVFPKPGQYAELGAITLVALSPIGADS